MKNNNYLPTFTSIHKEITTFVNGVKRIIYVFKHSAMLDSNGQPIPIDQFMIQSGQRRMLQPKEIVTKSPEEKLAIKEAKSYYKNLRKEIYGQKANLSDSFMKLHMLKQLSILAK